MGWLQPKNQLLFMAILPILFLSALILALDVYVFQFVKVVFADNSYKKAIYTVYWAIPTLFIGMLVFYNLYKIEKLDIFYRLFFGIMFSVYIAKFVSFPFLVIDDLIRLFTWIGHTTGFTTPKTTQIITENLAENLKETPDTLSNPSNNANLSKSFLEDNTITRSSFLAKTALISSGATLATLGYGIISGAHDYRVRKRTVFLPNLPKEFDGLRLAQLSDIHSGSFFNKTAVKGGIEMLLAEKPDIVVFTGDLVNDRAKELKDYFDIFSTIKAPLGVFSCLGNHDYGDYYRNWNNKEEKQQNFRDLCAAHGKMGWKLLRDENHLIEQNGEKLAIIGIENWGLGGFGKRGNLLKARQGTEEAATKILLSHDPSHWKAEVLPKFIDIDLALAGHTHGMQFGVEIGDFRWSPVKFRYEQWADLYQENNQFLYVNRGFGYLGFPGRVGILPEITILELKKSPNKS